MVRQGFYPLVGEVGWSFAKLKCGRRACFGFVINEAKQPNDCLGAERETERDHHCVSCNVVNFSFISLSEV